MAWYRLFGRLASGSNVKVRLNDYYLPGTGEEVRLFYLSSEVHGDLISRMSCSGI